MRTLYWCPRCDRNWEIERREYNRHASDRTTHVNYLAKTPNTAKEGACPECCDKQNKFFSALIQFREAAVKVDEFWDDTVAEPGQAQYPFKWSFDEQMNLIQDWVGSIVDRDEK